VVPATVVVGRVRIGALSSVWYGGVLRGNDEELVIGETLQHNLSLIQDLLSEVYTPNRRNGA